MVKLKKYPFSKRELLLVIVIFTSAIYFIGWHITGKQQLNDIYSIRSDINSLGNERALLLSLLEEGEILEEKILKAKDRHKQLKNILPDLESLPLVLKEMESFLAEQPVEINSLRIGDAIYYDHHAAVTMQLKATAAPFHLLGFLEQLEVLPNILYFDYLTWHKQAGSDVEMELKLELLFYHPEQKSQPQGGLF